MKNRCFPVCLVAWLLAACAPGPQTEGTDGEYFDAILAAMQSKIEAGMAAQSRDLRDTLRVHHADLSDRQRSKAYSQEIRARQQTGAATDTLVAEYRAAVPERLIDWFLLAQVYLDAGQPAEAAGALDRVRRERRDLEASMAFARMDFQAASAVGDHARAQKAYQKYFRLTDRQRELERTAWKRYAAEERQMRHENWRRRRWRIIWICTLAVLAAGAGLGVRAVRRKARREQDASARQLASLKREAARARQEAEQWKSLLEKEKLPDEVQALVTRRVEALNRYALQKLSRQDRQAAASLEETLSHEEREQFARDLRLQFSYLHPELAAYLDSRHLTEQELICCTLLLLGCQTKEIATQTGLSEQRCYNIFNTVRRKLGLRDDRRTLYTILSEKMENPA